MTGAKITKSKVEATYLEELLMWLPSTAMIQSKRPGFTRTFRKQLGKINRVLS